MGQDSRLRIVEVLKRRRQASVTDLSEALGLTPVTIRHHLDSLVEDRVVSVPVPRRRSGPGRPEMVYALTARAEALTPRNYGELCACLLRGLDQSSPDSPSALARAGADLGSQIREGSRRPALPTVIGFLEGRGYFPSVEQVESGQVVVLANCPYLEVARSMPHCCAFDVALLEAALGTAVLAEASIARHDPACRLRIAAPAGA
jgi:predicted ArsR family transcriptional regulator